MAIGSPPPHRASSHALGELVAAGLRHPYICVATFVSARYALPSGVTSAAAGRSRFEQK